MICCELNFKGGIEAQGTFAEISESNLDFTKILVTENQTEHAEHDVEEPVDHFSKVTRKASVLSTTVRK